MFAAPMKRIGILVAVSLGLLAPGVCYAQTGAAPDVNAAARAYAEGQRLQLLREYARAAAMFELADESAPSAVALRSAIRNRQAAGQLASAATLSLLALRRDGADAQSRAIAEAVLAEARPRLASLTVRCTPACALSLDTFAVGEGTEHAVMLDPGAHDLGARWSDDRTRTRTVELRPGQSVELELEAPAAAAPAPLPTPEPPRPSVEIPRPPPVRAPAPPVDTRPLPLAAVWVGVGATAVSAGLLVWSGLDTLSARDAYVASPTEGAYNDGVGRELRTNLLVGTTAVLGVATLASALFFTRWGRAHPSVAITPGGAAAGFQGRF